MDMEQRPYTAAELVTAAAETRTTFLDFLASQGIDLRPKPTPEPPKLVVPWSHVKAVEHPELDALLDDFAEPLAMRMRHYLIAFVLATMLPLLFLWGPGGVGK